MALPQLVIAYVVSADYIFVRGVAHCGRQTMELLVERVDVWAATIEDRPGGLAMVLGALRDAGANLQLVIARRAPDKPGAVSSS
jgi:hypothetical protein